MLLGRHDESMTEINLAQKLDPQSSIINANVGLFLYYERLYDQAIEHYKNRLEEDPDFPLLHYYLGIAYVQKKMYKEAIAELKQAISSGESHIYEAWLGHAYAVSGERGETIKIITELEEVSKQNYVSPYSRVLIYAGLGQIDKAFQFLEESFETCDYRLQYLKVEPALDGLRSDPRFVALLKRIQLN